MGAQGSEPYETTTGWNGRHCSDKDRRRSRKRQALQRRTHQKVESNGLSMVRRLYGVFCAVFCVEFGKVNVKYGRRAIVIVVRVNVKDWRIHNR